jgi:hypothetical protein
MEEAGFSMPKDKIKDVLARLRGLKPIFINFQP